MNIEPMMLQVLDDPMGVRIIVETSYPDFSEDNGHDGHAYFMIDRFYRIYDEKGNPVYDNGEVYEYWQVSDSLGQCKKFYLNGELIEFIQSIESIVKNAWVESF